MNIVLGITGSIGAIKVPELIRALRKRGHCVQCMVTSGGKALSCVPALEALTGNKVWGPEIFSSSLAENPYAHLTLSQTTDVIGIIPATANTLARLALGMADDLLLTTVLGASCPIVIAPAMNPKMWNHPATDHHLQKIQEYGYTIIPPVYGTVACGDEGMGKMAEISDIIAFLERSATPQNFLGKKVLISFGGTQEKIDPVRFIGNGSSGKMGKALAESFWKRGAEVTLCEGIHQVSVSDTRFTIVKTPSAESLLKAFQEKAPVSDIVVFASAVADFTPSVPAQQKIKSGGHLDLTFSPTVDIAKKLAETKMDHQFFIGFSLETENAILQTEMMRKAQQKKFDIVLGNNVKNLGEDTAEYVLWDTHSTHFEEIAGAKEEIAEKVVNRTETLYFL